MTVREQIVIGGIVDAEVPDGVVHSGLEVCMAKVIGIMQTVIAVLPHVPVNF